MTKIWQTAGGLLDFQHRVERIQPFSPPNAGERECSDRCLCGFVGTVLIVSGVLILAFSPIYFEAAVALCVVLIVLGVAVLFCAMTDTTSARQYCRGDESNGKKTPSAIPSGTRNTNEGRSEQRALELA